MEGRSAKRVSQAVEYRLSTASGAAGFSAGAVILSALVAALALVA